MIKRGLAGLSLFLVACLGAGDQTGVIQRGIFHGTVDQNHPAVVATFSNQSQCTATIIAVSGSKGYALTAAHCCTSQDHPLEIDQGVDDNKPDRTYKVTGYLADPAYDGSVHDFCMLQFSGADASTPVIWVMTPATDNLKVGQSAEFVGYGITESNMNNSQRRTFTGPISKLDTLTVTYPQTAGGPCEGDSGGPSLSVVNGEELVSSVTSYGDQNCTSYGVSGRVSGGYNSFIAPYLSSHGVVMGTVDGGTTTTPDLLVVAPPDLRMAPQPDLTVVPPPPDMTMPAPVLADMTTLPAPEDATFIGRKPDSGTTTTGRTAPKGCGCELGAHAEPPSTASVWVAAIALGLFITRRRRSA